MNKHESTAESKLNYRLRKLESQAEARGRLGDTRWVQRHCTYTAKDAFNEIKVLLAVAGKEQCEAITKGKEPK